MPTKNDVRLMLRQHRHRVDERNAQSAELCRHVLAWEPYRRARVVAAYAALPWEADVTSVIRDALACGKRVALPLVGEAGAMTFRLVSSMEELRQGSYGIAEPSPEAPLVVPEDIELMLVPLEAVDRAGMRLGKGGGYYDRVLPRTEAIRLGVALTWQWVDNLPAQPWDVPLDAAVSAQGITIFPRPAQ